MGYNLLEALLCLQQTGTVLQGAPQGAVEGGTGTWGERSECLSKANPLQRVTLPQLSSVGPGPLPQAAGPRLGAGYAVPRAGFHVPSGAATACSPALW